MTGIISQAPPKPTIQMATGTDPNLGPMYYVHGAGFSLGQVLVEAVADGTGQVMWSQTVTTFFYSGNPGATFGLTSTGLRDCSGVPNTTTAYYMTAEDVATGQWSNTIPIDSYC